VVDRTLANEPLDVPILKDVLQIDVRFLDYDREWREEWPPLGSEPGTALRLEPLMVEITLELVDFGVITRLFEVGG
jgi:type II secretion system protein J